MKEKLTEIKKYKCFIFGTLTGIIVTTLSLILFAVIFTALDLDAAYAHPIASVCCAIGSLFGGYISAKLCRSKGLINGILTGIFIFLAVTIVSIIVGGGSFTLMTVIRMIIILTSAAIGGILGVNKLTKKKIF